MKYDEKKAQDIIRRFRLADVTMKTWKHRGTIPDQYADPGYDPSGPALLKDTKRVIDITQLPEINAAAFTSVGYRKIVDVSRHHLRGKRASQSFTEKEVLAFKSEVTRLRNKLRAFTKTGGEKELKAVIADDRIKHYVLFAGQKRMLGRLYRRLSAYEYEIEECRVLAARLYNHLKW